MKPEKLLDKNSDPMTVRMILAQSGASGTEAVRVFKDEPSYRACDLLKWLRKKHRQEMAIQYSTLGAAIIAAVAAIIIR
jgi:hypothetical protein